MNTHETTLPRREICNVLRGSRSKVNGPEIKAARAALSEIYVASQNRQLTVEEDAAARGLIREVHRLNRERVGVPLLDG